MFSNRPSFAQERAALHRGNAMKRFHALLSNDGHRCHVSLKLTPGELRLINDELYEMAVTHGKLKKNLTNHTVNIDLNISKGLLGEKIDFRYEGVEGYEPITPQAPSCCTIS